MNTCPIRGGELNAVEVHNSLSRYVSDYICNPCGNREALAYHGLGSRGRVLYYDSVGGIMLVEANLPGYVPLGERPRSEQWARAYVAAVNARHGISQADQTAVVASSMFGVPC